jgi:DNA primase
MRILARDNEKELTTYLKMEEDNTHEEVESVLNYLKLRKVKRMLLENQLDLEKTHTAEEFHVLHQTHEHLKNMEIGLTKKMGAVVIR